MTVDCLNREVTGSATIRAHVSLNQPLTTHQIFLTSTVFYISQGIFSCSLSKKLGKLPHVGISVEYGFEVDLKQKHTRLVAG